MEFFRQRDSNLKNKIRIGIVGIGFGQYVLLPACKTVKNIEVCAIAATSKERVEKVAKLYGIPRAYASWQDIVNDPDLDGLMIAVPPIIQQDIIAAALLNNKHLFCEKPLGVSSSQTNVFASEAEHRNLANMVDFEFCAIPAWRAAQQFIQSGSLGKLNLGVLNWQVETYANRMKLNNWKVHPEKGGGVLMNFASHVFYNLEWLFGPISEVFTVCVPSLKIDIAVHGIIRFENDLIFNICVGSSSYAGSGHRIEIYGENGSFQLVNNGSDYINGFEFIPSQKDVINLEKHRTLQPNTEYVGDNRIPAVAVLIKKFTRWVETGEHQEPSFRQGHRVNVLLEACQASHQGRCWISPIKELSVPLLLSQRKLAFKTV